MADRYWVGGTGTWDAFSTANWATSSNGSPGASAPTISDNVFFDTNSDSGAAFTVTCLGALCANIFVSGQSSTVRPTFSGADIDVNGNFTISQNAVVVAITINLNGSGSTTVSLGTTGATVGGTYQFNSNVTYTVTGNPSGSRVYDVNAGTCTIPSSSNATILADGGVVNCSGSFTVLRVRGGTLNCTAAVTIANLTEFIAGTLNINSYTFSCGSFSSASGTRTLSHSGGNIVVTNSTTTVDLTDITDLTISPSANIPISVTSTGTGTKNLTGPTVGATAAKVFNLTFSATSAGTNNITGAWNNITFTSGSTAKTFSARTRTVYGDLTTSGATGLTYGSGNVTTTFVRTTAGGVVNLPSLVNGPNFPMDFNGVGGAWTFTHGVGDFQSVVTVTNGAVTFNSSMTLERISSSNSNTRSVILVGSNTYTLKGADPIDFTNTTGLTFTPANSSIVCSTGDESATFQGGGRTFYDVSFSGQFDALGLYGANTFNNLVFEPRTSRTNSIVTLHSNQVVSNTLTLNHSLVSDNAYARIRFQSPSVGTQATLTVGSSFASVVDCDFRDILISGSAGTLNVGGSNRGGNLLGNTNITFPAAKTVFFNVPAGASWTSLAWAASSGGSVANDQYPLAQDTAVLNDTGLSGGSIINLYESIPLPNLDFSGLTNAVELRFTGNKQFYFASGTIISRAPGGNRVSLRSTGVSPYVFEKSSGTVDVSNFDIQASTATGGAIWLAPTAQNNIDSGNNSGWEFPAASAGFFMLFN